MAVADLGGTGSVGLMGTYWAPLFIEAPRLSELVMTGNSLTVVSDGGDLASALCCYIQPDTTGSWRRFEKGCLQLPRHASEGVCGAQLPGSGTSAQSHYVQRCRSLLLAMPVHA